MGSKTWNLTGVLFFFTCVGLWRGERKYFFYFLLLFTTDRPTFLVPWLRESQTKKPSPLHDKEGFGEDEGLSQLNPQTDHQQMMQLG